MASLTRGWFRSLSGGMESPRCLLAAATVDAAGMGRPPAPYTRWSPPTTAEPTRLQPDGLHQRGSEGDLHRWMQVIGHDGRLQHEASDPVEVPKYGTAAQPR